jgi:CheY-like chemotaxis protein
MINEVLDISRLQSGKSISSVSVFSLRELVQELYRFFKIHTLKKDIILGYYFSDKVPNWLEGEKEPLRQVLTNLLSNAFKFTRYGKINFGVDSVENSEDSVKIHFTVSDTGIGIDADSLSKVFDPFFQVESVMQDQYVGSGSGLGLTIVKSIVEKNGGEIWIESEVGVGTKVHFSFVARKTSKMGRAAEIIKENSERLEKWNNQGRPLSILLAEDNYPNQMYIKRILEKKNINVTVASNGGQVLERVREKDFDVILMDIRMPKMDGLEAAKRIRAMENPRKSQVPIIALTGLSSDEERESCKQAGMDGFITKPIEIDHLIYEILRYVFP